MKSLSEEDARALEVRLRFRKVNYRPHETTWDNFSIAVSNLSLSFHFHDSISKELLFTIIVSKPSLQVSSEIISRVSSVLENLSSIYHNPLSTSRSPPSSRLRTSQRSIFDPTLARKLPSPTPPREAILPNEKEIVAFWKKICEDLKELAKAGEVGGIWGDVEAWRVSVISSRMKFGRVYSDWPEVSPSLSSTSDKRCCSPCRLVLFRLSLAVPGFVLFGKCVLQMSHLHRRVSRLESSWLFSFPLPYPLETDLRLLSRHQFNRWKSTPGTFI